MCEGEDSVRIYQKHQSKDKKKKGQDDSLGKEDWNGVTNWMKRKEGG